MGGNIFSFLDTYAGLKQSQAQRDQGVFKRELADRNAAIAQQRGRDALTLGQEQAGIQNMKGSQTVGAQKTAYAGAGVDVGSGSPVNAMMDTRLMSDLDASTVKANAARESWGYQAQATQDTAQGAIDYKASQDQADATALTAWSTGIGGTVSGIMSMGG